ncbi:hypothetical protein HDU79_007292 [Rhizoclosmatium sp. JEL0117]|nr:hypothetical protein HDU79_007292 [Rhizoclosmatium sp. JEL0117]
MSDNSLMENHTASQIDSNHNHSTNQFNTTLNQTTSTPSTPSNQLPESKANAQPTTTTTAARDSLTPRDRTSSVHSTRSIVVSVTSELGHESKLAGVSEESSVSLTHNASNHHHHQQQQTVHVGNVKFDIGSLVMESPRGSVLSLGEPAVDGSAVGAVARVQEAEERDAERPMSWGPASKSAVSGLKKKGIIKSLSVRTGDGSFVSRATGSGRSPSLVSRAPSSRAARSVSPAGTNSTQLSATRGGAGGGKKEKDVSPMSPSRVFSSATLGGFGSSTTWKLDMDCAGCTPGGERENLLERLNAITLWTKQTPLPSLKDIARELRFWLRILQLALTFGAFAGLSVGTFRANYMSSVLSTAGINFMAFTSISSGFVSISWIIVYLNPSTLGIAPHKHARISRIEVLIDLFFLSLWFAASVNLAYHIDMACPAKDHSCLSWDLALVFGYACGGGFALMGGLGVGDLRTHGWGFGDVVGRAVEARGGWVPERMARWMKDGVDEFED